MSSIVEVAIGLIFVFSLLSILVTQVNTLVGNALNLRAIRLKEGLQKLLTDPVVQARIMTHPLIGLVPDTTTPGDRVTSDQAAQITSAPPAPVSWIESNTFVAVLTDVLTNNSAQKLFSTLTDAIEAMPTSIEKSQLREIARKIQISGGGLPELREAISALPDPDQKQKLLESMNMMEIALDKLGVDSSDLIPLMIGIKQIGEPHLQAALEAVLGTATSLKDAQEKLGTWFDTHMTRASDLFKREMQVFSLVIGLGMCLILNIDTIQLGRTLWQDPALRDALTAAADKALQDQQTASTNQNSTTTPNTSSSLSQSAHDVDASVQQLLSLGLPIGWEFKAVCDHSLSDTPPAETTPAPGSIEPSSTSQTVVSTALPSCTAVEADKTIPVNPLQDSRNLWNFLPGNSPYWFSLIIQKIIGIVVTVIAIAQGAPFWFDILRKLTGA